MYHQWTCKENTYQKYLKTRHHLATYTEAEVKDGRKNNWISPEGWIRSASCSCVSLIGCKYLSCFLMSAMQNSLGNINSLIMKLMNENKEFPKSGKQCISLPESLGVFYICSGYLQRTIEMCFVLHFEWDAFVMICCWWVTLKNNINRTRQI